MLNDIFCQDQAVERLQKALQADRLAHAYIFSGPEGVGKFTTARAFARLLLCEKPKQTKDFSDACGQCRSCELLDADSHPDFIHIYKELREFTENGKGKGPPVDMPIDVIRDFLIKKAPSRPTHSNRKVFVVSEAEKVNIPSQNALLKILEEPPAFCTIILLCTRMEKLLATTKSRCQTVRFGPIDESHIIAAVEQAGAGKPAARFYARLSQGSLGESLQWARLAEHEVDIYAIKQDIIRRLANLKYETTLKEAQALQQHSKAVGDGYLKLLPGISKTDLGRRGTQLVLNIVGSAFIDLMKAAFSDPKDWINSDQQPAIRQLSGIFDSESAAEKLAQIYQSMRYIEANANERLIFEQLLLNIADSATIRVS